MVNIPAAAAAPLFLRRSWAIAGAAIALGICAFGFLFHTEIAMALHVWANSDAYNHCFLVLPVAAYLAWDRRKGIMRCPPQPAPWIAVLALPAAAAWFAADRLGIMEGRQLTAMALFQVMVASLIGLRSWRALSAPLLYLFFLVPFGEFLVPPLQTLVVHFTTAGLNLLGIPVFTNGVVIQIPEGSFLVHQACSGLRFLIASAAFGVLYACIMYTSSLRRLAFSFLAVAVAIVANCFRVLGTILIAHFFGDVQAVEADHVIWGWGFYVIVGTVLIVGGFAFRQDRQAESGPMPAASGRIAGAAIAALGLSIALAATPRAAAAYLNRLSTSTVLAAWIEMPMLPGCSITAVRSGSRASSAVDNLGSGVSRSAIYRCGGDLFQVSMYRYPPRIGVRPLFLSLRAAERPSVANDIILQTGDFRAGGGSEPAIWRVTEASTNDRRYVAIATALWLDGRPSGAGIAGRIDQALNTVRHAPVSPVLMVVTHFSAGGPNYASQAIDAFLRKAGGLSESVQKLLAQPAAR
jgi:exosortase A